MANVFFKRGSHNQLPTSGTSSVVDGAFYLTTDTHRLYVGQGTDLVELNKSITSVASISNLPTSNVAVGQFYYVTGSNILCYYSGTGEDNGWVQINPDTRIETTSQNVRVTTESYANDISGATVTSTVSDTTGRSSVGHFTVKGNENLDVSVSGDVITLAPNIANITSATNTTYTIGTTTHQTSGENDGANINLTSSDTTPIVDTVSIIGTNSATVTQANDVITINVADPIAASTASFNNQGVLSINTSVNNYSSTPATVTPVIKLGGTDSDVLDTSGYKFISGEATLPVYTKKETKDLVEEYLGDANAMTYKGTVGVGDTQADVNADATAKLVSTGNVGDTYKAANDITSPVSAKTGDLIIAKGTDGAVTYDIIPSGDDQTITGTVGALSVQVNDQAGELAGLTLASGAHMAVTGSVSGKHTTITIAQDTTGYTALDMSGATTAVTQGGYGETPTQVTYVTGLDVDAYGNVVANSVTTQTLTLTDTHNKIDSFTSAVTATDTDNANIALTIADHDGNQNKVANIGVVSDSLDLSVSSGKLSAELVWGSF